MQITPPMDTVLRIRRLKEEGAFESIGKPVSLGSPSARAYGGFALSMAVLSAFATVKPEPVRALYSFTGNFLGPTLTDRLVTIKVTVLRETRTFSTRFVTISQQQNDGSLRACLIATADFVLSPQEQDSDTLSLLRYSVPPRFTAVPASSLSNNIERANRRMRDGDLAKDLGERYKARIRCWTELGIEERSTDDDIVARCLYGIDKTRPTTQDHLPVTSKASSEWLRTTVDLTAESKRRRGKEEVVSSLLALNTAALAFVFDSAVPFAPLLFSHRDIGDVEACSSLDFALRFVVDRPSIEEWLYFEMHTHAAGFSRSYNETRAWNERGELIASMTQQGILRPHSKARL